MKGQVILGGPPTSLQGYTISKTMFKVPSAIICLLALGCMVDYYGVPNVLFQTNGGWQRQLHIDYDDSKIKIRGNCIFAEHLIVNLVIEDQSAILALTSADVVVDNGDFILMGFEDHQAEYNFYRIYLESKESFGKYEAQYRKDDSSRYVSLKLKMGPKESLIIKIWLHRKQWFSS